VVRVRDQCGSQARGFARRRRCGAGAWLWQIGGLEPLPEGRLPVDSSAANGGDGGRGASGRGEWRWGCPIPWGDSDARSPKATMRIGYGHRRQRRSVMPGDAGWIGGARETQRVRGESGVSGARGAHFWSRAGASQLSAAPHVTDAFNAGPRPWRRRRTVKRAGRPRPFGSWVAGAALGGNRGGRGGAWFLQAECGAGCK